MRPSSGTSIPASRRSCPPSSARALIHNLSHHTSRLPRRQCLLLQLRRQHHQEGLSLKMPALRLLLQRRLPLSPRVRSARRAQRQPRSSSLRTLALPELLPRARSAKPPRAHQPCSERFNPKRVRGYLQLLRQTGCRKIILIHHNTSLFPRPVRSIPLY